MITSEKGAGNCIASLFIGHFNALLKNCHPNTSQGLEGMMRVREF
jgi:hypothetical protein